MNKQDKQKELERQDLNEFIWSHWDDYFDNIHITYKSGLYSISCKKGLWCVSGKVLKSLIKQADWYFYQYWNDGEYDGTVKEKLLAKLIQRKGEI